MMLRLFDRLATLVKADAHGVLDALEERPLLLRQHLRDAELALLGKRARLEGLAREEERLAEVLRRADGELAAFDADAELALGGEREDLARFALRKLVARRRERDAVEIALAEVREARATLAERVARQERDFEELRAKVRAALAALGAGRPASDPLAAPSVEEEEVELELLRRRRGGARGGAPALEPEGAR